MATNGEMLNESGAIRESSSEKRISSSDTTSYDCMGTKKDGTEFPIQIHVKHMEYQGRKVRVMAGPLKDMEGVFRGYLRGGQRARVLMEFLRRSSLVEVETELLAAVRA